MANKLNIPSLRLMVVDDEEHILGLFKKFSSELGDIDVISFNSPKEALDWAAVNDFDVALVDYKMPFLNGLDLINGLKRRHADALYLVMTGYGELSMVVNALRVGAFDFLRKPVEYEDFSAALARVRKHIELQKENVYLRSLVKDGYHNRQLLGSSPAMEAARKSIALFAQSDSPVLITGETGVGKEIAARLIHSSGKRARHPFVAVNCSSYPETLIENEFFGHEKGGFTGAQAQSKGRFELAGEGTLLLDEIGELAPHVQAKLLRVLQEREFERIGGSRPIRLAARVIASTNKNVEENTRNGSFREDLYYRINTLRIHLPPLRERKEDIKELADHFREKFNVIHDRSVASISRPVMDIFNNSQWPGNVRQLENLLDFAVLNCDGSELLAEHLHREGAQEYAEEPSVSGDSVKSRLTSVKLDAMDKEKDLLIKTLDICRWNKSRAARQLGVTRGQLDYRLKKLSIE
ncbi:MAG: sigma-54-dependent Fis family transcriptional regulator [Nitrospinae bacterium]|nr:sigma-54-dependent Fis family transcriptional regulator [Nitrospinota bacterium]